MKSTFDVTDSRPLARLRHTVVFTGFVVVTVIAWLFYGGLVRRAFRRAREQGRVFYVDRLPDGQDKP